MDDGTRRAGSRPGGADPAAEVPRERLITLTDGVVAIALTLLVLDIQVPKGLSGRELDDALDDVWSQIATFLLSAVVIAVFWRAHHASMRRAVRIDSALFWLNIAFLVLVSLIPFPTSVLEDYSDRTVGPGLYGTVVGLAALLLYAMEAHIHRSTGVASLRSVPLPAQAVVFLVSVGIAVVSPLAALWSWAATVPLAWAADRYASRADRTGTGQP
ncbi:DUF1211 domain-containing protein [Streptomyces sp. RKND-216]|nr:DUF1211 domain-containing protein [Streptomyces sp. RKND-216]